MINKKDNELSMEELAMISGGDGSYEHFLELAAKALEIIKNSKP